MKNLIEIMTVRTYGLIVGLLVGIMALSAQTLDQARQLYLKGEYAKALPVFQREIAKKPGDMALSQWYGVSLYETGRQAQSIEYLTIAHKKGILGALPYLAEYALSLGNVIEAKGYVDKGIDNVKMQKKDQVRLAAVAEQLDLWLRMAQNATSIEVIDSLVCDKKEFLKAFHLSKELGTIHYLSDFFGADIDPFQTVFQNQLATKICFSQKRSDLQYELRSMDKQLDAWTNSTQLPGGVNDEGSNLSPYVLSDGITIYFASNRSGGLGGLDLYISRFNTNTNSYLVPENLGVPFNSAANDYLLVYDEIKEIGWFASDRYQPDQKVVVYTFLMNSAASKVDLIASNNPDLITLRSIKSTWKKGKSYAAQIALARGAMPQGTEDKVDFILPIQSGLSYYRFSDFRDKESVKLFNEYQLVVGSLDGMRKDLSEKRALYHQGSDEQKLVLTPEILTLEREIDRLKEKPHFLLIEIRNREILSIKAPQVD